MRRLFAPEQVQLTDAQVASLKVVSQDNQVSADIAQAERVVLETYGDTVSVAAKGKNLNKFGRNDNVDTGQKCTIAQFQGATQYEETFVATNLIDSIVSSSGSDTMAVTIEGHTIDGSGNLTYVEQNATLTGQTPVSLATPIARANRVYIKPSGTFNSPPASTFAGAVAIYDSSATTVTTGVPNTATAVKLYVPSGQSQSRKAATTISSVDYWFLTELEVSIRSGSPATKVEFQVERRDVKNGGVWRPFGTEISLDNANTTAFQIEFKPFLIVPPNHDVRVTATTTASNASVTADIQGYLALVQ